MHSVNYIGTDLINGQVALPASKSISNRLLVLNFLSGQRLTLNNLSKANDTLVLQKILSKKELPSTIDCEDAGTVFRFMMALCAAQQSGQYELTGTKRLLERPHNILINALRTLGTDIQWNNDHTALKINALPFKSNSIEIAGDVSSQFITALCLISHQVKDGLNLIITNKILSKPYIDLTLSILHKLGVKTTFKDNLLCIKPAIIHNNNIEVESDWSSACFLYALCILSNKATLRINHLSINSIQGDEYISKIAQDFNVHTAQSDGYIMLHKEQDHPVSAKEYDLSDYPDLAIPLITVCALKYPTIQFTGLEHLAYKESNRIKSLQLELAKVGIQIIEKNGRISTKRDLSFKACLPIRFHAHQDHRIAMSFSLLAYVYKEVYIDDIECIKKSFPDFFEQLKQLNFVKK